MTCLDRREAGRELAKRLRVFQGPDVVLLASPPGGVVVAAEIAAALHVPLDVLIAAELRAPDRPDLVLGAVTSEGRVIDETACRRAGLSESAIARLERTERDRLLGRLRYLRDNRPRVDLGGRTAVLVWDALSSVHTVRAAVRAADDLGAVRVVLAAPVAARPVIAALAEITDKIVCSAEPEALDNIDGWYREDSPPTDTQARRLLTRRYGANVPAEYVALTVRTSPWPTSVVTLLRAGRDGDA